MPGNLPWICDHCYYKHPDPVDDPFYQSTVKSLMYFCAVILLLVNFVPVLIFFRRRSYIVQSYLIGLWFSLRTHASQIWQNPQQLLHPMELPTPRVSQYHKLATTPGTTLPASLSRRESNAPDSLTTDDFTRAVAVATVSALRQQQAHSHSPGRPVRSATAEPEATGGGGHGGHDAPSWSRTTSASVLLACTALYAVIAGMYFDCVRSIC